MIRLLLWLLLAVPAVAMEAPPPVEFAQSNLTIYADSAQQFRVDVATTDAQLARGLMFRQALAADAGMLLLFDRPYRASIWMKDTPLALDLVFIGPDARIAHIHAGAHPYDETTITAPVPVRAVLEIPAGQAAARGLAPGQRVASPVWPQG